jgi:hypothetical protein
MEYGELWGQRPRKSIILGEVIKVKTKKIKIRLGSNSSIFIRQKDIK